MAISFSSYRTDLPINPHRNPGSELTSAQPRQLASLYGQRNLQLDLAEFAPQQNICYPDD